MTERHTPFVSGTEFDLLSDRFSKLERMMVSQNETLFKISQALEPAYGQKTVFARIESLEAQQLNLADYPKIKGQVGFLMKWFWTASGAGLIIAYLFNSIRSFIKPA